MKMRGKEPKCGSKGPENKALGLREDLREVWGVVKEGEMGLAEPCGHVTGLLGIPSVVGVCTVPIRKF